MVEKFINPNWHVILIHYPLALLTVGLVIELLSLYWRRDRFRAAGRWMIGIGGLSLIVTGVSGMYAFRDVMIFGPMNPDFKWTELLARNHWSQAQWEMITDHIWFNSISAVIFAAVIAVWLSRSEEWRKKFYGLMLAFVIIATGLLMAGAWHGGEMVYRYGTAVRPDMRAQDRPAEAAGPAAKQEAAVNREQQEAGDEGMTGVAWFVPPLQSHVVLAGLTAALAVAALGLTLHGWTRVETLPPHPSAVETVAPGTQLQIVDRPSAVRFWIAVLVTGVLAVLAGLWSVVGRFSMEAIRGDLKMLAEPDHRRLLIHVIVGVCLIVLALILAITTRVTQTRHRLKAIFIGLLLVAVFLQVWLGGLMIFDSHEGPLTGFSSSPAGEQTPAKHVPQVPTTTQTTRGSG